MENSDLSTAKSTGCGKVEISTRVFNRVWKTVLIIYICRKLPLWKRQWETFRKGCKAFFSLLFQSTSPCNISIHVPTVVREEERTSPFQINYIDCGRGLLWTSYASSAEGAQGASNASSLWIYACGGVRFIWDSFGVAPVNSSVERFCISLSSGISMFARLR